jgi:hypothetical protein
MIRRFVCLANSFKEGGRCLAGIELDQNNHPITENGHTKWIRPICNTQHEEVHTHLCSHINILDIIEIDIINFPNIGSYHSENALFHESALHVVGKYTDSLIGLCDNRRLIFGNRGKAVSQEAITNLTYSLMFIRTDQFEVVGRTYENTSERTQIRLVFSYHGNQYDFPVTDPDLLNRLRTNPDFLKVYNEAFLCLSMTIPWNDWYYKLVAGAIFINNPDLHHDEFEIVDDLPW